MKQITIISGKGGTGKTSLTSAFASIAKNSIIADCDVDAADMFIILKPEIIKEEKYLGGKIAVIDYDNCTNCGICKEYCRFEAIENKNDKIVISDFACDGCELCMRICPENAISMKQSDDNRWFVSNTRFGKMVHARLGIAEDLSGKLVAVVREEAKKIAKEQNNDHIIIDGPPGIGCPVIASITGIDIAVIVTEPTQSGLHDLIRVVNLIDNFKVKPFIIINKSDINNNMTKQIESYCNDNDLEVIANIPFDRIFIDAMVNRQTVIEFAPESDISKTISSVWSKISSYNNY
ncbi:MAG: P-loop NTPase [Bacteroidales bacterium]|nr:P-loop NTPase [Bacteroidales bacterium]